MKIPVSKRIALAEAKAAPAAAGAVQMIEEERKAEEEAVLQAHRECVASFKREMVFEWFPDLAARYYGIMDRLDCDEDPFLQDPSVLTLEERRTLEEIELISRGISYEEAIEAMRDQVYGLAGVTADDSPDEITRKLDRHKAHQEALAEISKPCEACDPPCFEHCEKCDVTRKWHATAEAYKS